MCFTVIVTNNYDCRSTSRRVGVWNLVTKREDCQVTTANERPVVGVAQVDCNKIIRYHH